MPADEIDFRLSSVLKIRVEARVSVGRVFEMSADPFDLLFLVKDAFLQSCRPADLPDKIPADFPAWRIRSDIALPHGKHTGKYTRRSVDHQFVPDREADVMADRTGESGGGEQGSYGFAEGFISCQRADRRFSQPAVYDDARTLTVTSLVGRAEKDPVPRNELLKDLLMAGSVLQSEDHCICPDQLRIFSEGLPRDIGFREEDDEIGGAVCGAVRKCRHFVRLSLSVPFDRDLITVDRMDVCSIMSYEDHFSVLREFPSEEEAH